MTLKFFFQKTRKNTNKKRDKYRSLVDNLAFSPEQFSFSKAIDVALASHDIKLQNLSYDKIKNIELKSSINFSSKFFDIKSVEGIKDHCVEIFTNLDGVSGMEGSLPDVYTENYITYNRESKQAVIDFLDIFNDRFLSIRYLFMKLRNVSCLSEPLENSIIGNILFSLSGVEYNEKSRFKKSLIPEQLKISCQNLFWRKSRSGEGLRIILSDFCDASVVVKQFSGKFIEADQSFQSVIGKRNRRYNRLGKDAILGSKVWDQTDGIDIFIGPLNFEGYVKFLPKRSKLDQKLSPLEKVKEIIKEYVPFGTSVTLHFRLDECFVKEFYLNGANRLNKDAFIMGEHKLKNAEFFERV
ncbi:MAG: type VI secretion system baseplate subunit TssG [Holosporales bacterium]|jgi:type VI secretion system protein ImpH|nr:type VI secretion system baseplate subunit TssG [Holosporales bacterium]